MDPGNPNTREAVAREIARAVLTAESQAGHNETEAMIWMHLGDNPDGLSAHKLAEIIGRDESTVRGRLAKMTKAGLIARAGNVRKLTGLGWTERSRRFDECWKHYPTGVKDIINREVEFRLRRGKP